MSDQILVAWSNLNCLVKSESSGQIRVIRSTRKYAYSYLLKSLGPESDARARACASGAPRSISRDEMRILPPARTHAPERFAPLTVQNVQACRGCSLDFKAVLAQRGGFEVRYFFGAERAAGKDLLY